ERLRVPEEIAFFAGQRQSLAAIDRSACRHFCLTGQFQFSRRRHETSSAFGFESFARACRSCFVRKWADAQAIPSSLRTEIGFLDVLSQIANHRAVTRFESHP